MIIYTKLEQYLSDNEIKKKIWIIDKNVYEIWNLKLKNLISNDKVYIIEATEKNKTLDTANNIINFLFDNNIDRSFTLIGLGGGIVGDISGFVSSIFLRGIKLIHVPTTLLAMVDSSIGGKTGVNNIYGKNMIGSIYQAKDIVIDYTWLDSLPQEQKLNGMAEVIKMALLKGGRLFELINLSDPISWSYLNELIELSANYKLEIIEDDFKDLKGCRELLNLGHTWGHGLELSQEIMHGFAVSDGIIEELKYTHYYYGFPSLGTIKFILDILKKWKLLKSDKSLSFNRFDKNYQTKLIYYYMSNDKKENRLVTLKSIGNPDIVTWNIKNWKFINSKYFKIKNPLLKFDRSITEFKIKVPSSKSITNRSLLCGIISSNYSKKKMRIKNILKSEDTELMISALKQSNINLEEENEDIIINPSNLKPSGYYYLGNSGTSVRFLLPLLAIFTKEEIIIDGNDDMRKRPIGPLVKSLIEFGCNIEDKEFLPIKIKSSEITKTKIFVDGTLSSQFVTGLLIALSMLKSVKKDIEYVVTVRGEETSTGFIKMTIDMLRDFGLGIQIDKENIIIKTMQKSLEIYQIEGDATTASYLFAWSFINKFVLKITNLNLKSIQPDFNILKLMLDHFGNLETEHNYLRFIPFDNIQNVLNNAIFDLDSSDTFLTWACLFYLENKKISIVNIKNQNWKECPRIDKFIENIEKIGGKCNKTESGFEINEINFNNRNIFIETEKDHRLAMSFSLISLKHSNIYIKNPHCVNKTYPKYWEDLKKIGLNIIPTDKIQTNTISLIGMPGTGKSTLAKELSKSFNLKCYDIDSNIENELGKLSQLIEKVGWKSFRNIESKQIFESIYEKNLKIISTGGGCIENLDSRNFLDDSIIIWIKRKEDPEEIKNRKLEDTYCNLYLKRKNIYENLSDYIYYNDKSPQDFVKWVRVVLFQNPIPKKSNFLCKSEIDYEENISNCIEFRADLNDNKNNLSRIQDLIISFGKPCIFTLRTKNEGGLFTGTDSEYLNLSTKAIKLGAKIIDIEVWKQLDLNLDNILTIGSIHNNNYEYIKDNLKKFSGDILKIVSDDSTCNKISEINFDNENLILIDNETGKFRTNNNFLTPISSLTSGPVAQNQLNYLDYLMECYTNYSKEFIFLFGSNIGESPSNFIHNEVISKYQKNIIYLNFETQNIDHIISIIKQPYFGGASVTMPYKEKITENFINEQKAINTISKDDKIKNSFLFNNTDTFALKYLIKNSFTIILGSGGAAIAAIEACENKNKILLIARNYEKINYLSNKYNIMTDTFENFFLKLENESVLIMEEEYQLINCLPPNVSILPFINQNCNLIDMTYGLHSLNNLDVKNYVNGYDVLYIQAAYQYMIWFKSDIKENDINNILIDYKNAMSKFLNLKYDRFNLL